MADDQAKFDLKIGLQVEGGDSAAQRIAALTKQIGGLERQASQMRGLANIPIQMQDLIRSSYKTAQGFSAARDQAKSLKPAIAAIGEAIKKTGLSQDVLKGVGLDDASLRAAGKNAAGFRGLIENLAKSRAKAISAGAEYAGKAESLSAERSLLTTNFNREQRLREEAARKAVATDKATEAQKTQAAMAGARERIAIAKESVAKPTARAAQYGPSRAELLRSIPKASEIRQAQPAERRRDQASAEVVTRGFQQLAAAARETSSALRQLSKSAAASSATQTRASQTIARSMMQEMKAGGQRDYAQLHQQLRRNEAALNPRYGTPGAGSVQKTADSYKNLASAADSAAGSISRVNTQGDAITGQIKNVLGMAFGYQAIHAVAQQLQGVFGHLKGGVLEFNSMLEQATVGFTTLFDNQARQAKAANDLLGKQVEQIDFIAMGYESAEDAANGVMNTIKQFANVTPFRFAELQESTLRMRAFGFNMSEILYEDTQAADKFGGAVVAVGNAVASLGGGADAFRRITYALGQMKQAGRVYQNDMMQLANAGIGGYQYIADKLIQEISVAGKDGQRVALKGQELLLKQLQSNAIETVRRLTTNGRISGEAASRAILAGLERDYGGGMVRQAKTFAGSLSTIADMSQSLVAEATKPLYESIRDVAYEFSQFLQQPQVLAAAREFSVIIKNLVTDFKPMAIIIMSVAKKIGTDLLTALNSFKNGVSGITGTAGAFIIGIREIVKLLDNDLARSLIAAAAAIKFAFAFGAANPFLTKILLLISVIGALKMAINENLMGVGTAFNRIVASMEPMITNLRDRLFPLLLKIGEAITVGFAAGLSAALTAATPILTTVADVLSKIADGLTKMEWPLKAIGAALGVGLASRVVLGVLNAFNNTLLTMAANLTRVAVEAATASKNLSMIGKFQRGAGFATSVGLGVSVLGAAGGQTGLLDQATTDTIMNIGMIVAGIGMLVSALITIGEVIAAVIAAISLATGIGEVAIALGLVITAIVGFVAWLLGQQPPKPEDKGNDYTVGTPAEGSGFYKPGYELGSEGRSLVDFRRMERESQYGKGVREAAKDMRDLTDYQKLLVDQQEAANKSLNNYNLLLERAKQNVTDALSALQKVAESVLQDIMNPKTESPYALDKGDLLSYEDLLKLEQELGFTQFENAQGLTRSFSEYKDILDAILPLSEDEVAAGEINLKQVTERLKIEKERRREQERIKALAQEEYDLGLATLQQYDESIDPLQRAINLRNAQAKYEKNINDLRLQGLSDLVEEATSSRDWARLTQATQQRLEDFKEGQQLILDEMTAMFERYNQEVAFILQDPTLSDAAKEAAIKKALDTLKKDLEDKFGITLSMMDAKVIEMNATMKSVMDAANMKGINMNVTFAQGLIDNLEQKGFKVLISYIMGRYKEILRLMQLIANVSDQIDAMTNSEANADRLRATYAGYVQKAITAMYANGVGSETINQLKGLKSGLSTRTNVADLQAYWNNTLSKFIAGLIVAGDLRADQLAGLPGLASGGMFTPGQPTVVGERGPEVVVPAKRGLVLNNSISSRLMGMLGGIGSSSSNNVTINVNNPVIRNDNDIRKLALEISRVQASQFRTEGGRL